MLGYSIDLPPPWRHSTCFSSSPWASGDFPTPDIFVPVAEYEEESGHTGLPYDYITVQPQPNPEGNTPRQWWDADRTPHVGNSVLTDITFAGRTALKIEERFSLRYLVAKDGLMFEVAIWARHDETVNEQTVAILGTFRSLTAAQLAAARPAPTPSPRPARSPEEVARLLADGFARKDVALLATLISRSCIGYGNAEAGRSQMNTQRYLDELRDRFARGLTVTVRPTTLTSAPGLDNPTRMVQSTWKEPGEPDLEVDLMISPATEQHWYWSGILMYPGGRR